MQTQRKLAGHVKIPGGRLVMQHEVIRPETRLALPTQLDNGMGLLLCTKCREHIVYHCCQVCLAMHHQPMLLAIPLTCTKQISCNLASQHP